MNLHTLGKLTLEGSSFQRPKALLLLSYLALEGRKERRFLAELFWPGSKNARTNLAMTLMRLRQQAGEVVDADDTTAWVKVTTDIEQMMTALEKGDLEKGLELYQGAFLEGAAVSGLGIELEDWLHTTRESLASQVQGAWLRLAEYSAQANQFEEAAKQAEAAFAIRHTTPDPEQLLRLHTLMLAGGSFQAAKVRKELTFFDEIAFCQSQEEAQTQLQESLGDSTRPIPSNLPEPDTSFVGRDVELVELAQLLAEQRLVTLTGSGGVGKSRLALQLAHEHLRSRQVKDGVYLVVLDALSTATSIPFSIATALELELTGSEDVLGQLSKHIGDKELLLLLDNFEHLIEAAPLVSDLLEACPKLKIIVTSRERLSLPEEWLFDLSGLAYPKDPNLALQEASYFDAVQLFLKRASRVRPDLQLSDDILPDVIEICQLVEGFPLAIELAAVWLRVMSCAETAEALRRNLDVLKQQGKADKHQSIRASFEHSWQLLNESEQAAFRKLSVFRGGFRRDAAIQVAGVSFSILRSLVDKSLMKMSLAGRYDRHPLLYQYSQEKLADYPEERLVVETEHGEYFFSLLAEQGGLLRSEQEKEGLDRLEEELENLKVAWQWAIRQDNVEVLKQVNTLVLFFENRGRYQEGTALFRLATDSLNEDEPQHHEALGAVLVEQAWLNYRLSHYDEAHQLCNSGIKILTSSNEHQSLLSGFNTLGSIELKVGNYDEAKQHYEKVLAIAQTNNLTKRIPTYLSNLAAAEGALGNYQEAKIHLEKALNLQRQKENRFDSVLTLNNLAKVHLALGNPQKAVALLEEALPLAKQAGLENRLPLLLLNLATASHESANYDRARLLCVESLEHLQTRGDTSMEAAVHIALGRAELALGDHESAEENLRSSLRLAWSIKAIPKVLKGLLYLAESKINLDEVDAARSWLRFVINHPTTEQSDRVRAEQLINMIGQHEAEKRPTEIYLMDQRLHDLINEAMT